MEPFMSLTPIPQANRRPLRAALLGAVALAALGAAAARRPSPTSSIG